MENPNYYAIIPANIRYAKDLSEFQKLLYWEITALTDKTGYCWAGNSYFSKLYEKKVDRISRSINDMFKKWYIEILIDQKAWNIRKIYIWEMMKNSWKVVKTPIVENLDPIVEKNNSYRRKRQPPIVEKDIHNNINITIRNNNNNISKDILLETQKSFSDLLKEILQNDDFIEKLKIKFWIESIEIKSSAENFLIYRTEKNPNWKKEKWQMEKTFDIQRRFYTRLSNNKKWKTNNSNKKIAYG